MTRKEKILLWLKKIPVLWKRIRINLASIKQDYGAAVTLLLAALSAVALFVDLTALSVLAKVGIIAGGIAFAILYALIRAVCTNEKVIKLHSGKKIIIRYGDIFDEDISDGADRPDNNSSMRCLAIGVNENFDVIVDNKIISELSLHGQVINMLRDKMNIEQTIQEELEGKPCETISNRVRGRSQKYPIGTAIRVDEGSRIFLFYAITTFDDNNTAICSLDDLVKAVNGLLKFHHDQGNGFPLVLPIIGAGLAKLGKSEQQLLEFLVELIRINDNVLTSDVIIVVRPLQRETVAITTL